MKSYIWKGYASIVLFLLIFTIVLPSDSTYIDRRNDLLYSNGTTLYVGGSGPGNFSSIQEAIDGAYDGDTIFVFDDSSPYYENIFLDKSIHLLGENKDTTILDGKFDLDVIWVAADRVTISGFTFQNADIGLLGTTNRSTISENIFVTHQGGIALQYSSHNTIIHNTVYNGYEIGIGLLYSSKANDISHNTISNTYVGLYLAVSCNRNNIKRNTVQHCSLYGMWLYWSFLNRMQKNNFIGNQCSAYFDNASYNLWLKNYWEDWLSSKPRPIDGIRYFPLLGINQPWTTYDLRPAHVPFDSSNFH
jgi:parallel beta-helix repeat protein